ncbi:hypothetical protein FACS1894132_07240 [Clostridia bacterium]|nr:hypothetical protein FACS1894132_07240 [Clostridia bacterium]
MSEGTIYKFNFMVRLFNGKVKVFSEICNPKHKNSVYISEGTIYKFNFMARIFNGKVKVFSEMCNHKYKNSVYMSEDMIFEGKSYCSKKLQ